MFFALDFFSLFLFFALDFLPFHTLYPLLGLYIPCSVRVFWFKSNTFGGLK
ncbi:hypothetical protein [uncultured Gammaproteobacteria bacterium]|uniref:Uncharacterized protein n=1 Tax=Bathymodiolus thermophilus thioautotrophic gill symbiont TaxID=2360 RepID=A0ABM8M692_9GAMM|nr:hypothetical protein AZO1586I_171 [Bathymodiolus thermophilus thioautotrophic gill symbiont]CAC9500938.1 hypothetical protein [uncultured Gammaproteobacteria bacterium]